MKDVCETLFEPIRTGLVKTQNKRILFMNAQNCRFLHEGITLQQGFKPFVEGLGIKSVPEIPAGDYNLIFHLFPKNIVEGCYQIARATNLLSKGSEMVCAANNKAGGLRLEKIFAEFGFSAVQNLSKNKARVVWGCADNINSNVVQRALLAGEEQKILGGEFISQPGIFGWDKVDSGSELLIKNLSGEIKGRGADFGCGYGYLSRYILENIRSVQNIICVDADYRAVKLCKRNLTSYSDKASFLWIDLLKPFKEKDLDFIVMNPPFHHEKKTDIGVGEYFINNAALALRNGGGLWMVANTHLPYEESLNALFSKVVCVANGKGFKVIHAIK